MEVTIDAQATVAELELREIESELVSVAWKQHANKYRQLKLLAEYDRRNGWIAHGATSCAVWWAEVCGIARNTAREQLRVARALEEVPALDAAMAEGRLSYAKVRVISRYSDVDNASELIEIADRCSAGRLGMHLAAWRRDNSSETALSTAQYDARSMSWRVEPDGMLAFSVRLPPSDGGVVAAAVDAQVMRMDAPAGASLGQLRADAMLELLRSPQGAGAEVVVHAARNESGEVVAALTDGTPVPNPQLAMLLCEATVRALLHDSEGKRIDASPSRRTPTKRQRRLLEARDQTCRYPGC